MKTFLFLRAGVLVFCMLVTPLTGSLSTVQANESNNRKIITFKEGVTDAQKNEILGKANATVLKTLELLKAKTVEISAKKAEALKENPNVLRVEDDVLVFTQRHNTTSSSQQLPWGVDTTDAEMVWPTGNTGSGVRVGVIDTGISTNHPDLLANVKGGVNTISPFKSWKDDNGHGSHVAGTIAAVNNTAGVVGVAPSVRLYAIKALSASGSGYLSDIIEGLQWAVNNNMDVVNMSLGTTSNIQALHNAVIAAKNAGVVVVAAAGNSGGSVLYPAAYPEAIAVSAVGQNNTIASFSSRGSAVDLAAPGVSIYSTYKGTNYATLSGTSMAAPHVAGAAALVLQENPNFTPDQVQQQLQNTATDLGSTGLDTLYGYGLVNAYNAVQ